MNETESESFINIHMAFIPSSFLLMLFNCLLLKGVRKQIKCRSENSILESGSTSLDIIGHIELSEMICFTLITFMFMVSRCWDTIIINVKGFFLFGSMLWRKDVLKRIVYMLFDTKITYILFEPPQ